MYFPVPNSISVLVNNKVVPPILSTSAELISNRTSTCGANKYFYQNGTIHFVITGACQVRIKLTSSVQITMRLDMEMSAFFSNDGVTQFIDRICAFLNINDTSRLKIVGVRSGSTIIDYQITPDINSTATT
jgi:hypothetical protein